MKAAMSDTEDAIAHIETATSYIEAVIAHMATATSYTAPGTIKPPFEPTLTAHEKMAKLFFFNRVINLAWTI